MEYISLYRKYRPTCFKEVVGQKYIIQTLLNSINQNKVAHAYIFSGSKGIGKTSIAKIFAKAVNCLSSTNGDACNHCNNCQLTSKAQTTDIVELDAASNNGVEEIRKIVDTVGFLPLQLKYKVYIIDEAHMLTTSAWNALLKTIEEPPHHIIFIFATTEMNKIPATIISRCQNFQFNRMSESDAKQILTNVASKEKIRIDEDSISKIIQLANGSARDLLSILDQLCLYTNNNISLSAINDVFGLVDVSNKIEFINLLINNKLNEIINTVDEYAEKGIDFAILVSDIISILLDKIIYVQTNSLDNLKILNNSNVSSFNLSNQQLIALTNIWQKIYMQMKNALDTKQVFLIGVFESLNLLSTQPQPAPIIQAKNPSVPNDPFTLKETIVQIPNKQEPVIEEFIITKPVILDKPIPINEEVLSKPQSLASNKPSIEELEDNFMHIAKNTSKVKTEHASNIIEKIKNDDNLPACFNPILLSERVFLASDNGVVLLFEKEADAKLLNKSYSSVSFQKKIVDFFKHPMCIIGFTKSKLAEFKSKFKFIKENLDDVNINDLKDKIDDKKSVISLANKLFGKNK